MPAINAVRDRIPDVGDGARVLPLWRGAAVDVVPDDGISREVLQRTLGDVGMTVRSTEARARLGAAGAVIDDADATVRLPSTLFAEALARTPGAFVLGGRDPDADLPVDGTRAWLSAAVAPDVVDLEAGEKRPTVVDDLALTATLVDATPQIGLVVAGTDPLRSSAVLLASTSKHVQVPVPAVPQDARALVEIALAVAGSDVALRERPPLSVSLDVDPPPVLDRLDAAEILARAGVPCVFEVTDLEGLAVAVGTVACLQVLVPGAPTVIGCASPSGARARIAWARSVERLGMRSQLPAFATSSASDDWRAGSEGGLAATAGWISPSDLFSGAGLRAGGRVSSMVAMLLDAELFELIRQIPLGFEVDEDALAVQVIADVGPAEHFLGEQHTLHHFRETWTSRFMDTSTWEAWEEAGRLEAPDHAREQAREILGSHRAAPLEPEVAARIEEVIAEHVRDR